MNTVHYRAKFLGIVEVDWGLWPFQEKEGWVYFVTRSNLRSFNNTYQLLLSDDCFYSSVRAWCLGRFATQRHSSWKPFNNLQSLRGHPCLPNKCPSSRSCWCRGNSECVIINFLPLWFTFILSGWFWTNTADALQISEPTGFGQLFFSCGYKIIV